MGGEQRMVNGGQTSQTKEGLIFCDVQAPADDVKGFMGPADMVEKINKGIDYTHHRTRDGYALLLLL